MIDHVHLIQNCSLDYGLASEARVQRELENLVKDQNGDISLAIEGLQNYDPRTLLGVLLDATAGDGVGPRIADPKVFRVLKDAFYRDFNGFIGGVTKKAYAKYARECRSVQKAAENHREKFVAKKETLKDVTSNNG